MVVPLASLAPACASVARMRADHIRAQAPPPPFTTSRRSVLLPVLTLGLALSSVKSGATTTNDRIVERTSSGLRYIDFQQGSGPMPRYGQILRFHYIAYGASAAFDQLVTFDSTYSRKSPFLVKHGNGFTCQGLEEALHTMQEGAKRRVILPPDLGYTADKGPMPPTNKGRTLLLDAVEAKKPLVFDLEVLIDMVTDTVADSHDVYHHACGTLVDLQPR